MNSGQSKLACWGWVSPLRWSRRAPGCHTSRCSSCWQFLSRCTWTCSRTGGARSRRRTLALTAGHTQDSGASLPCQPQTNCPRTWSLDQSLCAASSRFSVALCSGLIEEDNIPTGKDSFTSMQYIPVFYKYTCLFIWHVQSGGCISC